MKKTKKFNYFYFTSDYFEKLNKNSLKFTYEHDEKHAQKKGAEKEEFEKLERKYLKKNATNKYYRFYLCAVDDKLIGHIWFGQQDSDRTKGFIDELYVKPKYRNLGIATHLMKEAILWIKDKNCTAVELDVKLKNTQAIELYKKIGFAEKSPTYATFALELV